MRKVIPTVFSKSRKEFSVKFDKLIKVCKELQIDFMDGKFVSASSISLRDLPTLKGRGNFEAHIMVSTPLKWISKLRNKGFRKVIFHVEATKGKGQAEEIIELIHEGKMKAWIALNPGTSLKRITGLLDEVDGVMFLGVRPGEEQQKFIVNVIKKIKDLRKLDSKVKIQVDGGVNLDIAARLNSLGVDIINSGSFISGAKDAKSALKELRSAFK